MARQLRVHPPGGIHHVVARGNQRQPIFVDDRDRSDLLDLLVEARDRYQCELLAYCLMTNHVHLVIQDRDGELSRAQRHVIGVYAQRFNRRHSRTGHLFEQRFWNSLIEADSYLTVAVEYVHRNPLVAGMVDELAEYEWSSFPAYIGAAVPHPALEASLVLTHYGNDRDLLRFSTEHGARDRTREAQLQRHRPSPVLGSDSFVAAAISGAPTCSETAPSLRKASAKRQSIERIARLVAAEAAVSWAELHQSTRGRYNTPRSLAIHLAHQMEGVRLADIADHFGSSVSAVAMCSRRFELRLADEPELRATMERVLAALDAEASES